MRMRLLALALLALSTGAARAQTIAITGGTLHTITAADPISDGTVLIRDGRIVAVGANVAIPVGARVIEANGRPVTPGLFNAFTFVGLMDIAGAGETNDLRAPDSPLSAALDAALAINPMASAIPVTRLEGVTRVMVTPQSAKGVFAGFGALAHMGTGPGLPLTDPVFRARAFQFVELGETGATLAGGARSAAFVTVASALAEARRFEANRARYLAGEDREGMLSPVDADALAPVAAGRIPLFVHVDRASDILTVLDLRRTLPALKLVLVGAAEGWMVADRLAAARVPVILWPLDNLPARFDQMAATMANAGRLMAHGVTVALGSGPARDEAYQARLLPQLAGNLVAVQDPTGAAVSHAAALKAITLTPAQVLGVSDDLGTLEPGKIADIVIWDGDPLEVTSAPVAVFINGQAMPMRSRQTDLRDRYLSLAKNALPLQYRKP